MREKVLSEIRFIETDDGYRVEIKGDKEKLKEMCFMHKGFGPGKFFGRGRARYWGRGHGHCPPSWGWEEPAEEETFSPEGKEA